jgi:hypothetical protein
MRRSRVGFAAFSRSNSTEGAKDRFPLRQLGDTDHAYRPKRQLLKIRGIGEFPSRFTHILIYFGVNTFRAILSGAILVATASSAFAGLFNFGFATNNEGWTRGNFGNGLANITPSSSGAATWSAGVIAGTDHSGYAFHFSPVLTGDFSNLLGGSINLDFSSVGSGATDPFVVLVSTTGFLVKENPIPGSTTLNPYSFTLNASEGWYFNSSQYYDGAGAVLATNAQISGVLANLKHVGVSTDITSGGDTTRLDNVVSVEAVPEPATLAILGLGLAALKRRSRKA